VQQHPPVGWQSLVGHPEKRRVALVAEMLERADRHDAINGFVELFPAPQQHTKTARGVHRVEHLLHVRGLVLAQRQPHDIDVIFLDGALHRRAPTTAHVQQRHARLQAQLAQRQVDLGQLGLLERHVLTLEVRTAVGLRRIQEQPEKAVRQVVMRLHVVKLRRQLSCHAGGPSLGRCSACGPTHTGTSRYGSGRGFTRARSTPPSYSHTTLNTASDVVNRKDIADRPVASP
jgi:hypothetical protein